MSDHIFLGHTTAFPAFTLTRPGDGTPYTAGDVVGDVSGVVGGGTGQILTFPATARSNGGKGMVVSALLTDSVAAATPPSLELWLFSVAPALQADNTPFALTDQELQNLIGVVPLTTFRVGGANGAIQSDPVMIPFGCAGGTQNVYGVLVVRNAYTPSAGEVLKVVLSALQDY